MGLRTKLILQFNALIIIVLFGCRAFHGQVIADGIEVRLAKATSCSWLRSLSTREPIPSIRRRFSQLCLMFLSSGSHRDLGHRKGLRQVNDSTSKVFTCSRAFMDALWYTLCPLKRAGAFTTSAPWHQRRLTDRHDKKTKHLPADLHVSFIGFVPTFL